ILPGQKNCETYLPVTIICGNCREAYEKATSKRSYITTSDKCELIAHKVQPALQENEIESQTAVFVERKYPIPPSILHSYITTPSEIQSCIWRLHSRKAPGSDDIPYLLLKNLPRKTIALIEQIVNAVLKLQDFPQKCKTSDKTGLKNVVTTHYIITVVIPVLKPGKTSTDPASYRPISLLNSLGKLTKKVILSRLQCTNTTQCEIPHCTSPEFIDAKLKVSPRKTELIIFSRKFTNNKIRSPLMVQNTPIKPVKEVKYLGFKLDARLRFNKHVDYAI
ncbi:hypothetical protein YQE_03077, partial [Dendroctonus ponderosae]